MSFCTGCGKPLGDQARFCSNCGTPAASVASAAQVTSAVSPGTATTTAREPVPVPAPEPQLLMPQSNGGSPVLVIVATLLILLIGAGVGATLYMRRQPDTNQAAKETVTTVGNSTSEAVTSGAPTNPSSNGPDNYIRNLNLGAYPGASAIAVTDESAGEVIAAFRTRDTPEQVIGFYKVRFPVANATSEEGNLKLRAALPNGQRILIQAVSQANVTEVHIIRER